MALIIGFAFGLYIKFKPLSIAYVPSIHPAHSRANANLRTQKL